MGDCKMGRRDELRIHGPVKGIEYLLLGNPFGRFQFFESSSSREAWFQRLDAFYDRMKTERR